MENTKKSELLNLKSKLIKDIRNWKPSGDDMPDCFTMLYDYEEQVKKFELSSVSGSHSICEDCGGSNVAWGATDELWHKVAEVPKKSICPQCFVKIAERKLDYKCVIVGFKAEVVNR